MIDSARTKVSANGQATAVGIDAGVSVHEAIRRVIADLGGIGKNQRNKEQGYNFRGIDDVLKELHPLLAEHGVVIAPDVVERVYEERERAQGSPSHCAHLHVRYRVYGAAGDVLDLSTWGEGLDYGDTATNKAMTGAFKYMLFQLFAVADSTDDADHESPEGGATSTRTSSDWQPVRAVAQIPASNVPTSDPCPMPGCKGNIVQRTSQHGDFVSCTFYKDCGFKPVNGTIEEYRKGEEEAFGVAGAPSLEEVFGEPEGADPAPYITEIQRLIAQLDPLVMKDAVLSVKGGHAFVAMIGGKWKVDEAKIRLAGEPTQIALIAALAKEAG